MLLHVVDVVDRAGEKRAKGGPPGRCQKLGLFPDRRSSCRCRPVIGRVFQQASVCLGDSWRGAGRSIRRLLKRVGGLQRIRPCRAAQVSGAAKVRALAQSAFLQWGPPSQRQRQWGKS